MKRSILNQLNLFDDQVKLIIFDFFKKEFQNLFSTNAIAFIKNFFSINNIKKNQGKHKYDKFRIFRYLISNGLCKVMQT